MPHFWLTFRYFQSLFSNFRSQSVAQSDCILSLEWSLWGVRMITLRGQNDHFRGWISVVWTRNSDFSPQRHACALSKTGLFVTGLMTFVANWNELLLAMVLISDDTKKTLPVSLSKFVGPYNTNYSQMFAAIIIAIIPTIFVNCISSKQIVDGLTAGAVKG